MGELGDVLELAARSRGLWRTARLVVTQTTDSALQMRAIERAQPPVGFRRTSPPGDPLTRHQPQGLFRSRTVIVAVSTDRYRVEWQLEDPSPADDPMEGNGSSLTVRNGSRSWTRDGSGIYRSTDHNGPFGAPPDPSGFASLLDPQTLLDNADVESVGVGQVAGRATRRVRTRPRPPTMGSPRMMFLGWSADETLLDLDAATGLVFRMETFVDGATLRLSEASDVAIDESVDDALLSEEPPTGATVEPSARMAEPIEQVAGVAPFILLAPPGQNVNGMINPSRGNRPVVVHAFVQPDFAKMAARRVPGVVATLQLIESADPDGVPDPADWDPVMLADGPGHLWQAPDDGEVHLLVHRHGTYVWLRGLDNRAETITAAESLAPVPVQ